jgi:ubiquinone/menaquinone biosynthesis C-methylase UbiE
MAPTAGPRGRVQTMEGRTARWYDRIRSTPSQMASYRAQAPRLTAGLADAAEILEVAPGPGYQAIEIARLGRFRVTAVDISHTLLAIAQANAGRAGVHIDFHHGDARDLPLPDAAYDRVICQAAFKSFPEPVRVLNEMHRVLRPGGLAIIQDMRHEATGADIRAEVASMHLGPLDGLMSRIALTGLRRQAHSQARFEALAAESAFGRSSITAAGIGVEVRLVKA